MEAEDVRDFRSLRIIPHLGPPVPPPHSVLPLPMQKGGNMSAVIIICLALLIASGWCQTPVKNHTSPLPPVYPPRWSTTANFQFKNSTSGKLVAEGVMYQLVDSSTMRFRADDIYFAGVPFATTYDAIFITNTTDVYARLVNGTMSCSEYPQKPLPMTTHWIKDWCTFNSTVYHGAQQCYRWNCVADLVSWVLDTSVPQGLPVYQFTAPQPLFAVYQELWYTTFNRLDTIDQSVFVPPAAWNCPGH